jgi:hypothetical protein
LVYESFKNVTKGLVMPKVVPMQSSQETFQEGKKWRKIDNVVHKPKKLSTRYWECMFSQYFCSLIVSLPILHNLQVYKLSCIIFMCMKVQYKGGYDLCQLNNIFPIPI